MAETSKKASLWVHKAANERINTKYSGLQQDGRLNSQTYPSFPICVL